MLLLKSVSEQPTAVPADSFETLSVVPSRAVTSGDLQPFGFIAGKPVGQRKAKKADGGGGNAAFSGQSGPKPPPALSTAVLGMKKGGRVRLSPRNPCCSFIHPPNPLPAVPQTPS